MNALSHQGGFSLIEVMVAILILGVALVGLTHGITTALASSKESECQTTAALFAAGKIETLRSETGLENGEADGECGAGLEAYHWKTTVSGTDTEGLHEVTVIVENASSHKAIYELKTLLFEPGSDTTAKDSKSKKKGSAAK
jgi:prepilin-type N-terminal cleavage/methylation domain-containing protein